MKKKIVLLAIIPLVVMILSIILLPYVSYIGKANTLGIASAFLKDVLDYKEVLAVEKKAGTNPSLNEEVPAKNEKIAVRNTEAGTSGENFQSNVEYELLSGKSYIINVLFLGIDRTEERDQTIGIYRSDTICIARIDMNTKKVKVLSIPRDTYTFVPVEGRMDKINHAYAYGSLEGKAVESVIGAVELFLKRSCIDYYFSIDMEPIPNIVDEIGGVEVDVEIDMKTHGANLSKGLQVLDGWQAFDYIHWRYAEDGDIGRIKRQQKLAKAMFNKLKANESFVDFIKIVLKYRKNIETNFSNRQLIAFAGLFSDISEDDISYCLIPGEPLTIDNISYWNPDEVETDKIINEFFSEENPEEKMQS